MHKSGFVNIVGRPNAGKSTLMNQLVGEKMSIITQKPQTTRHRIAGIVSDEEYQIVFSDTPGWIKDPAYKMQAKMNSFISESFDDADIILFMTDIGSKWDDDDPLLMSLSKTKAPIYLLLNKTDLNKNDEILKALMEWNKRLVIKESFPLSALNGTNVEELKKQIVKDLPEGPIYYPKDQITDKPVRFFISEIIREKILTNFKQEIPYSCQVTVELYKEKPNNLVEIHAVIFVNRKTQKNILIGRQGQAINKLGREARKDIEAFIDKRVYLDLRVKLREGWRDDDKQLGRFGYN